MISSAIINQMEKFKKSLVSFEGSEKWQKRKVPGLSHIHNMIIKSIGTIKSIDYFRKIYAMEYLFIR